MHANNIFGLKRQPIIQQQLAVLIAIERFLTGATFCDDAKKRAAKTCWDMLPLDLAAGQFRWANSVNSRSL